MSSPTENLEGDTGVCETEAGLGVKIRRPITTALLSLIPIYFACWWYYVNREMADFGKSKQTKACGTSPGISLMAAAIWVVAGWRTASAVDKGSAAGLAIAAGMAVAIPLLASIWSGTIRMAQVNSVAGTASALHPATAVMIIGVGTLTALGATVSTGPGVGVLLALAVTASASFAYFAWEFQRNLNTAWRTLPASDVKADRTSS